MNKPPYIDEQAYKKALYICSVCFLISILAGCASNTPVSQGEASTEQLQHTAVDKFERFNRATFKFNDAFDRWLLKPVAKGYRSGVPKPVRLGVGNFFSNLGEIPNIINDGLQWKWKQVANDSGRFLMNSTLGVFGLFDVASQAGLEKDDGENFTQTLAAWGVPRGPYIVIPFLGPSTVRGGVSYPFDWAMSPLQYTDTNTQIGLNVLDVVHDRAELLQTEELISGDRYLFIREVFLQRLEYVENDGVVEDDFGGGDDEYFDDEYDF